MHRYAVTLLVASLLTTPQLFAQDADQALGQTAPLVEQPVEAERGPFSFSLEPYTGYTFKTDLDNVNADLATYFVGSDFRLAFDLSQQWEVSPNASVEYRDYDTGGLNTVLGLPSAPFDDLLAVTLRPGVTYRIDRQWAVFGGAVLRWFGDPGVDISDSFTGGGYAGARYALSEDLVFITGVSVTSELGDNVRVGPIAGVRWKINDLFDVDITGSRLGVVGTFNYQFADELATYFAVRYQNNRYRFDGDSSLPLGILKDEFATVGVGLTWTPIDNLDISFEVGAVVYREIDVITSNEVVLLRQDLDPTAYIALGVAYAF